VLATARRARLGLATVGTLLVAATALAAHEPGAWWIVLATLYQHTHALELSAVVFKNRIAWGVPVVIRAAAATLRLGFVVALWFFGVQSAALFLLGTAAGSSIANFLLHRAARPWIPRPTIPIVPARGVLREALPLGIALICQQLYFYVDNLFVREIEGDLALGLYNGAVRIMSFLIMAATYAGSAALPWLVARAKAGDLGTASARLAQPLGVAAGVGLGCLWPWSEELLRLVLGDAFAVAAPSLKWLVLATASVYLGAPLFTAVVAGRGPGAVLSVAGIALGALLVNVVGNSFLVPRLGIEGAALATFATESAVVLFSLVALARGGARPLSVRPVLWLLVPAAFALSAWLSSLLRSAV
jgi:O-antigen/teichoic acid export membrane protein